VLPLTPDDGYLRGVRDALAEVRRQLEPYTAEMLRASTVRRVLTAAAAELGVDEEPKPTPGRVPPRDGSGLERLHSTCIDVSGLDETSGTAWICSALCGASHDEDGPETALSAPSAAQDGSAHGSGYPEPPASLREPIRAVPRIRACVEAWPDCESGEYNPACCRFPKSCSCTAYDPEQVTDEYLEDR
jgi:hypothetical protein